MVVACMQAFGVRWIGPFLCCIWACQPPPPPLAGDLYGARVLLTDGTPVFDAQQRPRVRLTTPTADLQIVLADAETTHTARTQRVAERFTMAPLQTTPIAGAIEVRVVDANNVIRARWPARWAIAPAAHPGVKEAVQARQAGDAQAALQHLQTATNAAARLWVPVEQARALQSLGQSVEAEAAWLNGARVAHTHGAPSEVSRRLLSAAHMAWTRRDLNAMQERLDQAAAVTVDTPAHRVSLTHLRGVLAMETGAWQAAWRLFDAAARDAAAWGFAPLRHAAIESHALLFEVLGQPEAALQTLRGLHVPPDAQAPIRARYALNEGWLMLQAGEAGAIARFEAALAVQGPPAFQAEARLNMAWAHHQANDFTTARAELQRVLAFHDESPPASAALLDAELALRAQRFEHATRAFDRLIQTRRDPDVQWRAWFGRGRVHAAQGQAEAALSDYEQALAALAKAATRAPLRLSRSAFLDRRQELVDTTAALLLRLKRPAEALRVIDRARSRVLRDLRARARLNALPNRDRWVAHLRQIDAARKNRRTLEARRDLVAGQAAVRWAERLKAAQTQEDAAIDLALAWLDDQAPGAPLTPCDLQAQLQPRQKIIAFAQLGDRSLRFEVTADGVTARSADAPLDLKGVQQVWIAPGGDARAFDLPVGALPVAYLPYLGALCQQSTSNPGPPLLVVDPDRTLPAARREGRSLAGLWPEATVLNGRAATVDAVLQALPHAGLLHFSGHGVLLQNRPWDAFLQLADAQRLGLLDVLLTPLNGPVVVLNGCRTGDEALFLRADVPGLPEAFLMAGARAVVASTRDLPDAAAARFSAVFYAQGGRSDPMTALSRTREILKREGNPAWDAWRMYGR